MCMRIAFDGLHTRDNYVGVLWMLRLCIWSWPHSAIFCAKVCSKIQVWKFPIVVWKICLSSEDDLRLRPFFQICFTASQIQVRYLIDLGRSHPAQFVHHVPRANAMLVLNGLARPRSWENGTSTHLTSMVIIDWFSWVYTQNTLS